MLHRNKAIEIGSRKIGEGNPVYIVAELSSNHGQNFDRAVEMIRLAKKAGADAVKLQTQNPDTITIDCQKEWFRIKGTLWDGRTLHDLYKETYTPWEWQPKLKQIANEVGVHLFSSPFDIKAVDFLEEIDVPAYKIASFEIVDIPLVRRIARTGKPIIMSTGMASLSEIEEAVMAIKEFGQNNLAILKCTSAYPAFPEEMNLRVIPHLAETFDVPVGISDHSLSMAVAVASVALGACIIEKHFTLSRALPSPDSAFSIEPEEFKDMVNGIRATEKALGKVDYSLSDREIRNRIFRRSLFIAKDMKAGDVFNEENVKSIRPGYGLHTRYLEVILGRFANHDIERGAPLKWEMVGGLSA